MCGRLLCCLKYEDEYYDEMQKKMPKKNSTVLTPDGKGVVTDNVSVTYSGPILRTNKYAMAEISFSIAEIDPYDAERVILEGGYRGIRTTLETRVWKNTK